MIKPKEILNEISQNQEVLQNNWRLKLDKNENIYGCSDSILAIIKSLQSKDISKYPNDKELTDKFCSKYFLRPNNILFSNGTKETLQAIINAYLNKNETFLSMNSVFNIVDFYVKNADAKLEKINFNFNYDFDIEKIEFELENHPKIFYFSTPDYVTGKLLKYSTIKKLLEKYSETLFILDCSYVGFSNNVTFEDYLDLVKNFDNIIVLKSYSKDFALAGLRLCGVFADENIISNLKKITPDFSTNSFALNCVSMLLFSQKDLIKNRELNNEAKNLLTQDFKIKGFKAIDSEANFVLCDFGSYCDFCFEKLKANSVLTKKFPKSSQFSTCLRITIPTLGGVKYISKLLEKKDLLVFEIDNVFFDVQNSYNKAIVSTYLYFTQSLITYEKIFETKKMNALSCDLETIDFLLKQQNIFVEYEEIIETYKNFYYNSKINKNDYLINFEEFLLNKEILENISKNFDMAIFSNRFKDEILYSLKKYDIEKYFYFIVSNEDIKNSMFKPHPMGINKILKHCYSNKTIYFGASVDDVICGNLANVETVGVIPPASDYNKMINNYRHLGANYILENICEIEEFLNNLSK